MIKLLYKQALSAGARIRFDATVVDVFDDALKAAVVLENGERASGDIVLAADGIKSRTRQAVLSGVGPDSNWEPILDKTTFYSFDMPLSDLTDDPSTMKLTQNSDITTWMGNGGFAVTRFSAKFKRIGLLFAIQAQTDQESLWEKHGDIEKVRRFFSASCGDLTKALGVADTCDRWRVAEVPNLPRWFSNAGRIVLLGDSVHAMHPNAAQGFSTTLEDIGVLDYLFRAQPEVTVPKIVKIWQAICKPRAERVKDFARWSTTHFGGQDRPGSDVVPGSTNTGIVKEDVVPDMEADFGSSKFWKWNVEYDAILEVYLRFTIMLFERRKLTKCILGKTISRISTSL
jgi:salicylate hydroxylase